MGINTKATCATSSTLRYKQGEQPIVTTKSSSPIKGKTCLKLLPLPLLVVTIDVSVEVIVEDIATPSLMVSNRVEPLNFLFATIPLNPL